MDFFDKLEESARKKNSLLCVGLDPRLDLKEGQRAYDIIIRSNKRLIESTAASAAAFKPNSAFYEAFGEEGFAALAETIRMIPEEIPVILDVKRNDIGSTAEAYARAAFEYFRVDAVTLNPYLGSDAVIPFLSYPDKGAFVLSRTSNPTASFIQDLCAENGEPLYVSLAGRIAAWDRRIGLVVAGNDSIALSKIREKLPETWLLAPGIGAQGGSAGDAVRAGIRKDGLGLLVSASRSIAGAEEPGTEAAKLRDLINDCRSRMVGQAPGPGFKTESARPIGGGEALTDMARGSEKLSALKRGLLSGLLDAECFKTGNFTLKSGKQSPFYIDLRRIISSPELLKLAAAAYAELAAPLRYDRIAGIPSAGLPLAAALSLKLDVPMIYPRIPVKAHGTGNRIEGDYYKGDKVLLLDDLITAGTSKMEAVEVLRGEGLEVTDLVVLIERGRDGRRDLGKEGIRLHAYADVYELLNICYERGIIDTGKRQEIIDYLSK